MEERPINVRPNRRRRRAQLLLLLAALVMLVLGFTKLSNAFTPAGALAFWLLCLSFTLAAMILAIRDMRDIRRQTREERVGLAEEAFDSVTAKVKEAKDKRRAK